MEIFVYSYGHVDFLPQTEKGSFEIFKEFHVNSYPQKTLKEIKELYEYERNQVAKAFVKNGWEGDGTLMLIWFPPFVDYKIEDTFGSYVWHVKQSNNGTSFLGFINEPPTNVFRNLD